MLDGGPSSPLAPLVRVWAAPNVAAQAGAWAALAPGRVVVAQVAEAGGAEPRQESPDAALDDTLSRLLDGLSARQLEPAPPAGPIRIELPLLVDGQPCPATLVVHHQPAERQGTERARPEARLELEVELSAIGRVRADIVQHEGRLWCWLSTADEAVYRRLRDEVTDVAQELEQATGEPAEVQWFWTPRRPAAPRATASVDVRM